MHLDRRLAWGETVLRVARAVGRTSPYAPIALILPGGTLIALTLWTLEHRFGVTIPLRRLLVVAAAAGTLLFLPG